MEGLSTKFLILLLGIQYHGHNQQPLQAGVHGEFIIEGLPTKKFAQLADVNIGILMGMSHRGKENPCTDVLDIRKFPRFPEVISYFVQNLNNQDFLPYNMTLGFVLLDDCGRDDVAAIQALSFVRRNQCSAPPTKPKTGPAPQEHFDVVAVIGSYTGSQSVSAAHVLGPAQIPQISVFATDDELSDTHLFPYFMRVLPPNRYQFSVVYHILKTYGWTYISLLYSEGPYGESAFRNLKMIIEDKNICMAVVRKLSATITDEEAERVAQDLLAAKDKAQVVVVIAGSKEAASVVAATGRLKPEEHFIWIATDAWTFLASNLYTIVGFLEGALLIDVPDSHVPEFKQWFLQLTPDTTSNPWFVDFWNALFNCSFQHGTCPANVTLKDAKLPIFNLGIYMGYIHDAVKMIASAVSRILLTGYCDGYRNINTCASGPRLLQELKATRLLGRSGLLELDSNGDRAGKHIVKQLRIVADNVFTADIFSLDHQTNKTEILGDVVWGRRNPLLQGYKNPLSQCNWPCPPGNARVLQRVACCWTCKPCDVNERITLNMTRCERCRPFTWPDPDTNSTTCAVLPVETLNTGTLTGMSQISMALVCLVVCVFIVLFFQRHRHIPIMFTCRRDLSLMILVGIASGYVSIILMAFTPTNNLCRLIFFLYTASFTLIYAPIFERELQVFSVVAINQVTPTVVVLFVQLFIIAVSLAMVPNWQIRFMVSPVRPLVEHTCFMQPQSMSAAMLFNMALAAMSAVWAIKNNSGSEEQFDPMNENRFRFITVCIGLVLAVCFIPAFMVATHKVFRVVILVLCMLINHTAALNLLFLWKIYHLVYKCNVVYRLPSSGQKAVEEVMQYMQPCQDMARSAASAKSRKDN